MVTAYGTFQQKVTNEMTRLPTEQQCLDYFNKYKVPDNIFRHCCKVREVAVFLAQELQKKVPIDVEFVSCLAYFHDLCKMIVIKDFGKNQFHKDAVITEEQKEFWQEMQKKYPDMYEGEVAHQLFKDTYPELAASLQQVSSSKNEEPSWEQLIVHYADLRVLRERVVTVSERFEYLHQRYPRPQEVWKKHQDRVRKEEQKIFAHLSFEPDQVADQVNKSLSEKSLSVQHG